MYCLVLHVSRSDRSSLVRWSWTWTWAGCVHLSGWAEQEFSREHFIDNLDLDLDNSRQEPEAITKLINKLRMNIKVREDHRPTINGQIPNQISMLNPKSYIEIDLNIISDHILSQDLKSFCPTS